METQIEKPKRRGGQKKGTTHSGSFKKGDDPRRQTRMARDPITGKPVSIAALARADTYLALELIRKVIPDETQRMELRLTAAKTLVNLGWADAPRAIISSVTHHNGSLPSVTQLMDALQTGQPLQLPELPSINQSEVIDIEATDSLTKGTVKPVKTRLCEDLE